MHTRCLVPGYHSKQIILLCYIVCWSLLLAFYPCCCSSCLAESQGARPLGKWIIKTSYWFFLDHIADVIMQGPCLELCRRGLAKHLTALLAPFLHYLPSLSYPIISKRRRRLWKPLCRVISFHCQAPFASRHTNDGIFLSLHSGGTQTDQSVC